MTSKGEQLFAFGLALVCLVVGIVCYAACPQEKPEEPVRIMFQSTAGKILFDHKNQTADEGYGVACDDCHHEEQDESRSNERKCVAYELQGLSRRWWGRSC
jgi:hypothetical protein